MLGEHNQSMNVSAIFKRNQRPHPQRYCDRVVELQRSRLRIDAGQLTGKQMPVSESSGHPECAPEAGNKMWNLFRGCYLRKDRYRGSEGFPRPGTVGSPSLRYAGAFRLRHVETFK